MPNPGTRTPIIHRFLPKTRREPGTGCLVWQGRRRPPQGHGQISQGGREGPMYAHRLAWELAHGPIPAGLFVCHRCDNPRCVEADHLFLGTNADNLRDAARKGRTSSGAAHSARIREAVAGKPPEVKRAEVLRAWRSRRAKMRAWRKPSG